MYNVLIRPLVKEDALTSYQWRNDSEIWKFTGSRPNITVTQEVESEWIEKVLKDDSSKRFAILCDGEYIGNVQLTNINNDSAEFHIFIGKKEFWGKGISQLATYQILYYAKEVLKLSEVYLFVRPENIAAIKSYQNNNFTITEQDHEHLKMSLSLSDLPNTTLSVFIMVYNHAEYLKECIDNILNQKTDFNYDIVVGEDCSKDNSREILLDYQKLYPGKFKLLLYPHNMGAVHNQKEIYKNCLGKYIAICEGDDYWTNPLKLQKQVSFLEQNPEYSLSFHKIQGISLDETEPLIFNNPNEERDYSLEDLSKGNFIHTPSVVFRKNIQELPQWINYSPIGDYPLHMINASFGLIKYFPELMAAYRVGSGIWSTKSKVYQMVNVMFCLRFLIEHFKQNQQVCTNLKKQYDEYYTALSKPIEDREKLSLQIKDYHYIEKIIDFNNLLKIAKLKIAKKIGCLKK
ncbi:GNAT family N-acetyltransferase [Chryseobacterium rhizoplanae]|uniref:GNAT family N-acetyltransferase n=1 Tax=Chryseobacterium rhizoplanae TaxID=1609531 RepID=UPI001CE2F6D8|nr:GNAT family N-acetyltransferase [Chryseobacterium rhizoplanae]UCA58850.1 GNAT family N-acetyltransferase [Chryseobacterium rhizoplanae]